MRACLSLWIAAEAILFALPDMAWSANFAPPRMEPAAAVVEIVGEIEVSGFADHERLAEEFGVVFDGETLSLPAAASISLVFFTDGHRERVSGGGPIRVGMDGCAPRDRVEALPAAGAALQRATVDGLSDMRRSHRGGASMVQAHAPNDWAHRPIDLSTVLEDRPEFAWAPLPGTAAYVVGLTRRGQTVWQMDSANASLRYPADMPALDRGGEYVWTLDAVSPAGKNVRLVRAEFKVATAALVDRLEALRPLSMSRRYDDLALAAMIYEESNVLDRAIQTYERATEIFPDRHGAWVQLLILYMQAGRQDDMERVSDMLSRAYEEANTPAP